VQQEHYGCPSYDVYSVRYTRGRRKSWTSTTVAMVTGCSLLCLQFLSVIGQITR